MTIKCSRALDLFSGYVEGEIESEQRAALEAHMAGCPDCHSAFERFNAAIMMLEEMPEVEVPADFHAAVMARVERARRRTPRPVRWWQLDWQRAFTVRVPVRAAAMGLAVILIAIGLVRLTPMNGVVGGFFTGHGNLTSITTPSGSYQQPKAWPPWGVGPTTASLESAGIKITIQVESRGAGRGSYAIRLDATGAKPVSFDIYRLQAGASKDLISSGAVAGEHGAVTVVRPDGQPAIVKVSWVAGASHGEALFLPAAFSPTGAKSLETSTGGMSLFDALSEISANSGVVIMASGDLSGQVTLSKGKTVERSLWDGAAQAGLKSRILASSIYAVGPAGH